MTPEQYTDDAVCFAMGLGRFVPELPVDVLRLVCRPSFDPEVCITLTSDEITTIALHSMLWRQPIPARMIEFGERAELEPREFTQLCDAFTSALRESSHRPKWVAICDGMAVSAVRVRDGQVERYSGHACNDAERHFVRGMLLLALSKATSVLIRNRISRCGQYVSSRDDDAFPIAPEPELEASEVTRLLVSGTPEARAEFHAMMGARPAVRPST
jgi:hypothetical protein